MCQPAIPYSLRIHCGPGVDSKEYGIPGLWSSQSNRGHGTLGWKLYNLSRGWGEGSEVRDHPVVEVERLVGCAGESVRRVVRERKGVGVRQVTPSGGSVASCCCPPVDPISAPQLPRP